MISSLFAKLENEEKDLISLYIQGFSYNEIYQYFEGKYDIRYLRIKVCRIKKENAEIFSKVGVTI